VASATSSSCARKTPASTPDSARRFPPGARRRLSRLVARGSRGFRRRRRESRETRRDLGRRRRTWTARCGLSVCPSSWRCGDAGGPKRSTSWCARCNLGCRLGFCNGVRYPDSIDAGNPLGMRCRDEDGFHMCVIIYAIICMYVVPLLLGMNSFNSSLELTALIGQFTRPRGAAWPGKWPGDRAK
jgi:hypothetical protein